VYRGFGWIRRTGTQPLVAELRGYEEFAVSGLPRRWPGWLAGLFDQAQLHALETLAEAERTRPVQAAHLAHGDFDVTHLYVSDGRYIGIIDFGEIRGADLYFDLGHFLLHDGETRPAELFDSFLAGYTEVTALSDDHKEAILISAILLGLRQLSLWLGPGRGHLAEEPPRPAPRGRTGQPARGQAGRSAEGHLNRQVTDASMVPSPRARPSHRQPGPRGSGPGPSAPNRRGRP
jgi:Ser/Thr protein kinase RdoA (MazF antagonist)